MSDIPELWKRKTPITLKNGDKKDKPDKRALDKSTVTDDLKMAVTHD